MVKSGQKVIICQKFKAVCANDGIARDDFESAIASCVKVTGAECNTAFDCLRYEIQVLSTE